MAIQSGKIMTWQNRILLETFCVFIHRRQRINKTLTSFAPEKVLASCLAVQALWSHGNVATMLQGLPN
jgi:hypothetical protein